MQPYFHRSTSHSIYAAGASVKESFGLLSRATGCSTYKQWRCLWRVIHKRGSHVTSPTRPLAEVAKTIEKGGVLYDPKIETSHRKNRCPKLERWQDDPVITGSYPRNLFGSKVWNDGAKIFWFLVKVDARGNGSAIYIHHYSSEAVAHELW